MTVISVVEEWRLAFAPQPNIETVSVTPVGGDEPLPQRSRLDCVEHRIFCVVEEHRRLQLAHQARVEDQEVDMRRAALIRARLDGAKAVFALGVGGSAAPAEEARIVEAPAVVGLPDLEDYVVERLSVELHHPAGKLDDFAVGTTNGQIIRALRELARKERAEGHLARGDEARHGIAGVPLRPRTTIW